MANMSAETQAIIDRLKAEGDLIRNTGTNSIKATNMQLAKFEGLFNAISSNIAEQTDMMRTQLGIVAAAQASSRTEAQFAEINTPPPSSSTDDGDGKQPLSEVGEKTGNKIASALSMKNLAIGAAGLFVGYNLIKGAIDEATGGGFTNMEKAMGEVIWEDLPVAFNNTVDYLQAIDWSGVQTAINVMSGAINAINWTNFTSAINTMSSTVTTFTTWLGDTGVGDIVSAVIAGGVVSAGARGAVMGLLAGPRGNAGLLNKFRGIGPGLAVAAAGLAVYYGDDVATWMADHMGVENAADNETVKNLGTVFQIGGASLSMAMMFGPGAMIAVAAATAAVGLGVLIHGWVKNTKAESAKQFAEDVEAARLAVEESEDKSAMSDEAIRSVLLAAAEARRRQQLALANAAVADAEAVEAEMEAIIAEQNVGSDGSGANALQMERVYREALAGDADAQQELQDFAMGLAQDRGWLRRSLGGTDEEHAADTIRNFARQFQGGEGTADEIDAMMRDQETWKTVAETIAQKILNPENQYSQGTGGFKDFGKGTLSVLHGSEAVVTEGSFEGQILKGLADGSITMADRVSGGTSGVGMTVVNAPVIAPSPVTVTNGGSTVSSVSYGGMGTAGAGGSLTVYGLTGAVQ